MIERHVDIATPDGAMGSFVVHPDAGARPVVLFLMDAPGKREELHDMVRRLASAGYYVILSNLYYREVAEFNLFESGDRDRMFALMDSLSNAMSVSDANAMLAYARNDPAADTSKVGVVGYCMSGPFALAIASSVSSIKAAASFHGVRLAVDADDSPHRHLHEFDGEVYVGCAETDHWAPTEMIAEFDAALQSAIAGSSVRGCVEWYPGTEHGFVFPQRPAYNRESAERHWSRLHDLFARNLQR
jgi:carboxymethylenebutenolidase